ncbi:MAG: DUF4178 domain-containing protein [Bacteroidales bacterium]|nr:DUF4178 domain-containing protein [Bacteroidales bacterium]
MGIFDFFKKKEEKYDALNIKVTDIDMGFVFDYNMETWMVTQVFDYDWGNNNFSKEFKIENGKDSAFLNIDQDDELTITISSPIKIGIIEEDIAHEIEFNQHPPKELNYKGRKYFFDEESPGFFRADEKEDWIEFISWDYYDEKDEYILSIEQWDERKYTASHGVVVPEFEISNILPKQSQ